MSLTAEQRDEIRRLWGEDELPLSAMVDVDTHRRIRDDLQPRDGDRRLHYPTPPDSDAYFRFYAQAVAAAVAARVNALETVCHEHVCIQWGYCKRRDQFSGDGASLAIAVAEVLIVANLAFTMPVTLLAVYLVKKGLLEVWCRCRDE